MTRERYSAMSKDRGRRTVSLRADWRLGEDAARSAGTPAGSDVTRQRQDEALQANDRIRGEAPEDPETRRGADQPEREIKRSRRAKSSSEG